MVEMLISGSREQEVDCIKLCSRELAAKLTEEKWEYYCFHNGKELESFVSADPMLDMICVDLTMDCALELVQKMRKSNEHAYITLIATPQMSPASYMRPGIMAGSLLVKPLTHGQIRFVMEEAFQEFVKRFMKSSLKEQFVIDSREGRTLVDYSKIYYFEARAKKIFLVTENREFAFYDTLEHLLEILPGEFLRCHRGLVVNTEKIERICLGKNQIILKNKEELPLSRSFRPAFKEFGL